MPNTVTPQRRLFLSRSSQLALSAAAVGLLAGTAGRAQAVLHKIISRTMKQLTRRRC